jgi:hypothetical protein
VTRVLLLVIDGLGARQIGPQLTPTLWKWAGEGGRSVAGGRSVMTSATYPNLATLVTGVGPQQHGIDANWLVSGNEIIAAWEVGPRAPTLFEACRRGGRSSIAVLADHHLVGVTGAHMADHHWPPQGVLPEGTELDLLGYAADDAVLPLIASAWTEGPDLLVAHLNSPDTFAHVFGPDSAEAVEAYGKVDQRLTLLDQALRPGWEETVVVVVSDHDQELAGDQVGVDLRAIAAAAGAEAIVVYEGSGAVIVSDRVDWLAGVDGVAGQMATGDRRWVVWGQPGRFFADGGLTGYRGIHGGLNTRNQLALVTGGHPAVKSIAANIGEQRPAAGDWATTTAGLLGLGGLGWGRSLAERL